MELPGGNYRVLYRLKVSDNSGTSPLCKLYVRATRNGVEQEIASAELRPCDFHRAGVWETFALPVEVRDDDEDVRVGVEFCSGTTDLWCDWIRLVLAEEHLARDAHVMGSLDAGSIRVRGVEVVSGDRVLKNVKAASLLPQADNAHDLGSPDARWRDIHGAGALFLGDIAEKNSDTFIKLMSHTGRTRVEFREWAAEPQYGFDIEYDSYENALIVRARDGGNGPKEHLRLRRANGEFLLTRASPEAKLVRSFISGEAYPRFMVRADGTLWWGGGGSSPDVLLRRPAPGKLLVKGSLILDKPEEGWSLESRINSRNRFIRWASGRMRWIGPDGTIICELRPMDDGLSITGKLDVQAGLMIGGSEVLSSDRTLRNVVTGVLNVRAFRREEGGGDVEEAVEPHVEGRQFMPVAVEALVGETSELKAAWEVLEAVGDGKRIVRWLVRITYDELSDKTVAVVQAVDEEGEEHKVLEVGEVGNKAGRVKIWALEI